MIWGAGERCVRVWTVAMLCTVGALTAPALSLASSGHGAVAVSARKHAKCTVPKLKGDSLSKARHALKRAHCAAGKVQRESSTHVRKGHVISSKPKAGAKRAAGTKVKLVVSSGHKSGTHGGCSVPNVTGLSVAEATTVLKGAHCTPGATTKKHSSKVPAGFVISTDPKHGKRSKSGKVKLVVSSGPKGSTGGCTVPAVSGLSLAAAESTLAAAHCTVGKVTQKASSSVPSGDVISTNPKAGKKDKSGKVSITVSAGPGCTVPNVVGLPLASAEAAITSAHCTVGKVTQKHSKTVAQGDVIETKPKAGKTKKPGGKVDISVSSGPSYSVPKP